MQSSSDQQESILVVGDSHSLVWERLEVRDALLPLRSRVVAVAGASVSGLENPNSVTNALPIFNRELESSAAQVVVTLLGEVDTGFVIWYRAEKYGMPAKLMLEKAIRSYCAFLIDIAEDKKVVCVSAPLPTIPDNHGWGDVANARREVKASLLARTEMTRDFNRRLAHFCSQSSMTFIDLDEVSIGSDGLVAQYLRNNNSDDHHYDESSYADLIVKHAVPSLRELIEV